MAEHKIDKKAELAKARRRVVEDLGIDLEADLPDRPIAVVLPHLIQAGGLVHPTLGRVLRRKDIDRKFRKVGS
ncbi:MAG: hypothetical protein NVV62_10665 [Terricaulis sp.]|nr:hypothetical protein [Terricaulis sp.]